MKLELTDPSEPAPNGNPAWTGYWSGEVQNDDGELVARFDFASADLTPTTLRELAAEVEELADMVEAMEENDE